MNFLPSIPPRSDFWKPLSPLFKNRVDAGQLLGKKVVETYEKETLQGVVVFGLIRGGVPLAEAVVKQIEGKATLENLNVVVCRKIPRLDNKEFAIGSISEDGAVTLNSEVEAETPEMQAHIERVKVELTDRINLFRSNQPFPNLTAKTVIIVDDGLASGRTMCAAVNSIQKLSGGVFRRMIVAVPVSSLKAKNFLLEQTKLKEEDICIHT